MCSSDLSARNSKLWDAFKNNKAVITLVDGQRFSETGAEGQHISTLTKEELLMFRINSLYNKTKDFKYPTVPFLQMADKKSVYGITIKDNSLICHPNEVHIHEGKVLVPQSFLDRLWDIYENYKEFDKLGLNNRFV